MARGWGLAQLAEHLYAFGIHTQVQTNTVVPLSWPLARNDGHKGFESIWCRGRVFIGSNLEPSWLKKKKKMQNRHVLSVLSNRASCKWMWKRWCGVIKRVEPCSARVQVGDWLIGCGGRGLTSGFHARAHSCQWKQKHCFQNIVPLQK